MAKLTCGGAIYGTPIPPNDPIISGVRSYFADSRSTHRTVIVERKITGVRSAVYTALSRFRRQEVRIVRIIPPKKRRMGRIVKRIADNSDIEGIAHLISESRKCYGPKSEMHVGDLYWACFNKKIDFRNRKPARLADVARFYCRVFNGIERRLV